MVIKILFDENPNDFHIKNIIKQRKIQNLIHFTRIENLESILKNGLLPRQYLENNKIKYVFNDTGRWDEMPNATCVSIEFPNIFLLNTFKEKYKDSKWVIISLDINLLDKCSKKHFCNRNAGGASDWVNSDNSSRFWAFESMFDEKICNNSPPRSEQLYLKRYLPTNVQAEILIEGKIDSYFIKKLIFETQEDLNICKDYFVDEILFEDYNPIVDERFYDFRENFPWEDR